jgi:hypothetical protein
MRIVKVVVLLGVVIAIAVWMLMYFSPYNFLHPRRRESGNL